MAQTDQINRNGRIRSIVFDFDGTLAEPLLDFSLMTDNLRSLARRYLPDVLHPPLLPVLEWLKQLAVKIAERDGNAADEFHRKADHMILEMEMEAARRGNLFPFTRPLLAELKHRKLPTAIITRNCNSAVRLVFPDLDEFCRVFLARDHVPHVKPHPDHLLRALHAMGVRTESALMVGDHPMDIQTGRNAGVLTAGVGTGKVTPEVLSRSGAHWTANNCMDLIRELTAIRWL
ncbi:MAG: HAD family hydrolase [Syntrophobacteraceae bacterium]|nr:HAD family hydrolase [Syntrophobacteraceae bacterium]